MNKPKHILVIRFSALGDVAMTVPVVRLLLQQYPELRVTFLSDPFMAPLFEGTDRLEFLGVSVKKEYKGLAGLWRLARLLRSSVPFDAVADLHSVFRSRIIRLFLMKGPVAVIDKGRAEKKSLTRLHNKQLRPLKSGFQRYADVFEELGFPVELDMQNGLSPKTTDYNWLPSRQPGQRVIGVAPFARHAAKMYPLNKMEQVVRQLAADARNQVVLFGSSSEAGALAPWEGIGANVHNVAGRHSFRDELHMISSLQLMVSMDSANMHLASLYGVPVVSVWGGTHPWMGFYGWGQNPDNAVQSNLPCRPSSVFGNKPCPVHGEAGCMQDITPEMIVQQCGNVII